MENNKYKKQAQDFLEKYNLSINIQKAIPQKSPLWSNNKEHGINYWVTIHNNNKSYSFDYWGSIADREKIENGSSYEASKAHPTAYDILACLDVEDNGTTYEDFCSCFGYEEDSRQAEKTYKAVMVQSRELRKILSEDAIEELREIN